MAFNTVNGVPVTDAQYQQLINKFNSTASAIDSQSTIPGQTGAASQTTSGPTPKPQADNAVSAPNLPSSGITTQPSVQAAINQRSTSAVSNPLTSYKSIAGADNAKFDFFPNALDQYASYTYHIRWSMTSDADADYVHNNGVGNFHNGVSKVIIAESGATALYNITEFSTVNTVPGNNTAGNTSSIISYMTITEPYGITMIDNMWKASTSLGIPNYRTTHSYFVELWFTGYNEDGTIATPSLQSNLYKVWQMGIKTIESDTTEAGSTYKIEFLPQEMFAHSDHVGILANGVNIGPVTTVGGFFDNLSAVLTAQNASLYQDNTPRITYKIMLPSIIRNWQFDQQPTSSQRNSDITITSGSLTRPTISLSRGMDIATILNIVISMTQAGQKYTVGDPSSAGSGTSTSGAANSSINGMFNLIVVHSDTTNGRLDPVTNDYFRRVRYTFRIYPTGRAMGDKRNVAITRLPANQIARKQAVSQSRRFVKHYFWTYTGQNLDVLKFNVKILWTDQVPITSQLGYNTYANFSQGPQFNQSGISTEVFNQYKTAKTNQQAAQITLNSLQANRTSSSTSIAFANKVLNDYTAELATIQSAHPTANFASANQGIAATATANTLAVASKATSTALSAAAQVRNRNALPNTALNLQGVGATQQRQDLYLEDIAVSTLAADPMTISFRANPQPTSQTTVLSSDGPQEHSSASSSASDLPPSRSLVASVLAETSQTSIQTINLDIRGDPYWMGVGNVTESLVVRNDSAAMATDTSAAWFLSGDCGFVFTLRTGQSYDENTGLMNLTNNVLMYNGIYFVIKVKSIFKSGQFTQELTATKDALTSGAPIGKIDYQNLTSEQTGVLTMINANAKAII